MDASDPYRSRRLMFGDDAELYDRARPSYPVELVDRLVRWVGPEARVVDVGCGTGKVAALLAARGMRGVGVEPHPAMAAVAERVVAGAGTPWRVDVADFETWSPRPGADDVPADLVTCAQACTPDDLVDYVATYPNHRLLPEEQFAAVLRDLHAAVADHGGRYDQPYETHLWALRRP